MVAHLQLSSSGGGMDASFWCFMCRRLHHTSAGDDLLATCPRCVPPNALEEIVEIMDADAFLHGCCPQAWARHGSTTTGASAAGSTRLLPEITVRDAARSCAVCLDDLEPGTSALVTPCDHVYHPQCITPWLEANDTCPLCRTKSMVHVEDDSDGDGAASARDGLVLCELLDDGRYHLGRRVAGRVFEVRILDQDGRLVRGGLPSRLGAACRRFSATARNLLRSRDRIIPDFNLLPV